MCNFITIRQELLIYKHSNTHKFTFIILVYFIVKNLRELKIVDNIFNLSIILLYICGIC